MPRLLGSTWLLMPITWEKLLYPTRVSRILLGARVDVQVAPTSHTRGSVTELNMSGGFGAAGAME